MGWKQETNVTVNIQYPGPNQNGSVLTYLFLTVYQVSVVRRRNNKGPFSMKK